MTPSAYVARYEMGKRRHHELILSSLLRCRRRELMDANTVLLVQLLL